MQKTFLAATGALVLFITAAGLACFGGDDGGSDTEESDAPTEQSDAGGSDAGGSDPGVSDPGELDPGGGFDGPSDPEDGFAQGGDDGSGPSQLCMDLDRLDAVLASLEQAAGDEALAASLFPELEGAVTAVGISAAGDFIDENVGKIEAAFSRYRDAVEGRVTIDIGGTAAPIDEMQASVVALKTANCQSS